MGEILKGSNKLLDSIPTTFLFTDAHSRILYASRKTESFFGYDREELQGQRMRVLFLDEDLVYFCPNIIYLTLYKNGFDGEALLRRKDGKKIFVHIFSTAFREEGEIFLSFVFQEIQRMKFLEKQRSEVERWATLGRMVEGIAHQFRNPIASIGGFTQRLLKKGTPSSPNRLTINRILKEAKRLEMILQRVEEYVRLPQPIFERQEIQEVVKAASQSLAQTSLAQGMMIRLDAGGVSGEGSVFIDRGLVTHALGQVLENSLEAIRNLPQKKQKGSVEITLFDNEENVGVTVTDRGHGIAKKNLGLIFEPFFTTQPQKVGLGLTLARKVMEDHGGKILVDSRLGRGSTVTLLFPKDRRRKLRRESILPEPMPAEGR